MFGSQSPQTKADVVDKARAARAERALNKNHSALMIKIQVRHLVLV